MNRKLVFIMMLVFFSSGISAVEKVILQADGLGRSYSVDGGQTYQPLTEQSFLDLREVLNTNPQSAEELKNYDAAYGGAFVCAIAGGFGIGWPLGSMITGSPWSTLDTIFISVGVAGLIGMFVFDGIAEKHLDRAVAFYNGELSSYFYSPRHQFAMGFTDKDVFAGVHYRF